METRTKIIDGNLQNELKLHFKITPGIHPT